MGVQLKSRASFDAYLRRGEGVAPSQLVQVKYNHNHDYRGQFSNAANAVARGGESRTSVGSGTAPKPTGPFQFHATRKGKSGDAARAMNRIAIDPKANVNFDLGGHTMTIRRTGPNTIKLSMGGGVFTAEGSFALVPGKQAVELTVRKRNTSRIIGKLVDVTSFPEHIRIFEASNSRLVYRIDKPITGSAFGQKFPRNAGGFYFEE